MVAYEIFLIIVTSIVHNISPTKSTYYLLWGPEMFKSVFIIAVTMVWMKDKDGVRKRKQRDERGLLNEQAGQGKGPLKRFAVVVVWPYTTASLL